MGRVVSSRVVDWWSDADGFPTTAAGTKDTQGVKDSVGLVPAKSQMFTLFVPIDPPVSPCLPLFAPD